MHSPPFDVEELPNTTMVLVAPSARVVCAVERPARGLNSEREQEGGAGERGECAPTILPASTRRGQVRLWERVS
jgi:hypothetical protein